MKYSEWLKTLKVGSEVYLTTKSSTYHSESRIAVIDDETPKRWTFGNGNCKVMVRKEDGRAIGGGGIVEVDDIIRSTIRTEEAIELFGRLAYTVFDSRHGIKKMDVEDIEKINGHMEGVMAMIGGAE